MDAALTPKAWDERCTAGEKYDGFQLVSGASWGSGPSSPRARTGCPEHRRAGRPPKRAISGAGTAFIVDLASAIGRRTR